MLDGEPADGPGERAVRGLDRERAGLLGEHPVRRQPPMQRAGGRVLEPVPRVSVARFVVLERGQISFLDRPEPYAGHPRSLAPGDLVDLVEQGLLGRDVTECVRSWATRR